MSEEILFLKPVSDKNRVRGDAGSVSLSASKVASFLNNDVYKLLNEVYCNSKDESGFELDEIEVSIGVTASGKIGIFGSGVEGGAQSGLTLKFKIK